jgi:hypothetical protein
MKKKFTLLFLFIAFVTNAQAYKGEGDFKIQIGASIQDGGTGISASGDYGIGQNISIGVLSTYLLGYKQVFVYGPGNIETELKPKFGDRIDLKARFNANLGNVFGLDERMDLYPGLNLGLRNFGGHLGFRYFFTDGFGVFSELGIPIAKYNKKSVGFQNYNNQFTAAVGVSFNI